MPPTSLLTTSNAVDVLPKSGTALTAPLDHRQKSKMKPHSADGKECVQ